VSVAPPIDVKIELPKITDVPNVTDVSKTVEPIITVPTATDTKAAPPPPTK
jgi:hypothetical protein